MEYAIEVIVLPVSDVDRAKAFYTALGFREDVDYRGPDGFRVVHVTPPGSAASIVIGSGITEQTPGSSQAVHLVVDDIRAARADLEARGARPSAVFHDAGGVFHHAGVVDRVPGPHPDRQSYGSFLSFTDPDGNLFVVQEVTTRRPGRVDRVVYRSVDEVEKALIDAARAHGEYEKEIGRADENWPAWYAAHLARAAGLGA
ncbi:VOC family protein [Cryptosporangium arvum]|uniref:Lactoylglutathione lyase-like lyase n=1 Tax=Cryptosporangium arvum DSM 44712 TaxID=927661 RepID=A0A010ZZB1_9ACTN|nr:VOC family protein [Cryptosporangium arvum]EXG82557.1 lactoylglutathione lyase-like lyase [Cryptosporangium arvum DSM 44712]